MRFDPVPSRGPAHASGQPKKSPTSVEFSQVHPCPTPPNAEPTSVEFSTVQPRPTLPNTATASVESSPGHSFLPNSTQYSAHLGRTQPSLGQLFPIPTEPTSVESNEPNLVHSGPVQPNPMHRLPRSNPAQSSLAQPDPACSELWAAEGRAVSVCVRACVFACTHGIQSPLPSPPQHGSRQGPSRRGGQTRDLTEEPRGGTRRNAGQ